MCELRNNAKVRTRNPLLISPSAEGERCDPPFRRREGRVGFRSFAVSHFRLSILLKATLSVSRMGRSFRISHII